MSLYVVTMRCPALDGLPAVHAHLGYAHDFYRVTSGSSGIASVGTWILCTNEDASWWYDRLNGFAKPDGSLLVVRLSEDDYRGYMETRFWDWFAAHAGCV